MQIFMSNSFEDILTKKKDFYHIKKTVELFIIFLNLAEY